jgi:multidrug efflux pump
MKNNNLTEWALNHKQLMYFFVVVIIVMGILSYKSMGRMEDPDFTLRQMIVTVNWPGASARQVEEQVTDKLERKLQDTPGLDYLKSYSKPGEAVIFVFLKDSVVAKDVKPTWSEVRNIVADMKETLPEGVIGPHFNDNFSDVFGSIYALTGDGYTYEELREKAEKIRRILVSVPNVKKIDLVGVQPEKIYIELESSKLAQLGIDPQSIITSVQAQNAMSPSGMVETQSDNVYLRVTGMFENIENISNLPIRADERTFRLGDIAKIERSYIDPPEPKMYYNGQPAIGIEISMEKGGNILTLGKNLDKAVDQIKKELPAGLEISPVADQPKAVELSIDEFVESLAEAVIIVLIISFLSLGLRSGLVVGLSIPLVILGVFVGMKLLGIDLQKISLGALIIALGLLVDDAIISVEMMLVKLEQGWDSFRAACYAYTATAFPMLTGTLITCAGFIPVGFAKGSASEFVGSIFSVVTIALLISWVVAITITPMLGYLLIKQKPGGEHHHDIYDNKFYVVFKKILVWCLEHRKLVLGTTVVCFAVSIFLLGMVKQEFFPASTRPELIIDMRLPEGASIQATELEAQRFAQHLKDDTNIVSYAYYVGEGGPRFILTADPTLPSTNFAEFIVVAKDAKSRVELNNKVNKILAEEFTAIRGNTKLIQTGPPDPYPVAIRVSGYDHEKTREIAAQVREEMGNNPNLRNVNMDWDEKSKVMHLEIDQDKARALGINTQALASSLQTQLTGAAIGEFREKDKDVNLVFRIDSQNRNDLSKIKNLNIHIGNGKFVPLDQVAKISFEAEDGLIWRRNLKPAITVQANVAPGVTGNDVTQQIYNNLKELRANLPQGYSIDIGGPLEQSQKSGGFILEMVPIMLIIIAALLMFQLQSVSKMFLTLLTAPLGIIGASLGLLVTGRPMGFVVQLGILALSGIIMRNSVILLDQIEQHSKAGEAMWDAIINAVITRFRPIMLTAMAAILAMIPLRTSVFWGPMAVAMAGGLFVATILTLLVLPTMFAAWYKVSLETPRDEIK